MNEQEAIEHLRERQRKLDGLYRDHYPRWTATDFCSVGVILSYTGTLQVEVERLRSALTTTLVACSECGKGVRDRHAVLGLCPACAEAEIERLRGYVTVHAEHHAAHHGEAWATEQLKDEPREELVICECASMCVSDPGLVSMCRHLKPHREDDNCGDACISDQGRAHGSRPKCIPVDLDALAADIEEVKRD